MFPPFLNFICGDKQMSETEGRVQAVMLPCCTETVFPSGYMKYPVCGKFGSSGEIDCIKQKRRRFYTIRLNSVKSASFRQRRNPQKPELLRVALFDTMIADMESSFHTVSGAVSLAVGGLPIPIVSVWLPADRISAGSVCVPVICNSRSFSGTPPAPTSWGCC